MLDQSVEQNLIEHLDDCQHCQESLEARSGDPETWSESGLLLRVQPFDDESVSIDWGFDCTSPENASVSPSVRHVLQSLSPTDDPHMLGRIGHYEVSGVIGAGGMGVVLKAFDQSLDRAVAIKVLAPHLACSGAARQRFAHEAKAAAAVLHPNVIAIHGVSTGDESEMLPYLVMPYVRGSSLQNRIDAEGPLAITEVLRVASQIAAGLAAAHAQGLVHRDIKPANILLEDGIERVSITDFGLARTVDDATLTQSGVIAGTPQYMSPEQAAGEAIDFRSDLFSLGSVIYAMSTGRPPFRAENAMAVMRRICDDTARPIRQINPDVPAWVDRLVAKQHAKKPEQRYENAKEVTEVLQQCIAHLNSPATPLPTELQRPKRWKLAAGFAVALIALLSGFTFSKLGPDTNRDQPHQTSDPSAVAQSQVPIDSAPTNLRWIDQAEPSLDSVRRSINDLDKQTSLEF